MFESRDSDCRQSDNGYFNISNPFYSSIVLDHLKLPNLNIRAHEIFFSLIPVIKLSILAYADLNMRNMVAQCFICTDYQELSLSKCCGAVVNEPI